MKKGELTVRTEAIQVLIKQAIIDGVLNGENEKKTFKRIRRLIEQYAAKIPKVLRQDFMAKLAREANKQYQKFSNALQAVADSNGIPTAFVAGLYRGDQKAVETAERAGKPTGEQIHEVAKNIAENQSLGVKGDYTEYIFPDKIPVKDIRRKVKAKIRELSAENDGELRNRAEIYVRHEAQQNSIDDMRRAGVRLVWASTHVDCSKRCEPWQGRLYSLDGKYGEIDGKKFQPLENATDIYYTTKAGKVWKNGLLGFGCRHRLIPYEEHQEPPKAFSVREMDKFRKLNEKQRELERRIRAQKSFAWEIINQQPNTAQKLFERAREQTEQYRVFCRKNNLVALPYRTQVMTEEIKRFQK